MNRQRGIIPKAKIEEQAVILMLQRGEYNNHKEKILY